MAKRERTRELVTDPKKAGSSIKVPCRFGKYQLIRRIGKGGMAEVFLGRPKGQQRLVAVKCMDRELSQQQQFVEMFIREGKLAVQLNHDAIVKTYEIGRVDKIHFICMEYISGVDLSLIVRRSRSHRSRRLPIPHALYIASRICDGLHHAHELTDARGEPLNVVNRDVSASNVRVSFDGEVKLFDFGIAKATSGLSSEIGVLKGKIGSMSPEQVRGLPLDRRSDLFAVGIVLHEMLTGKRLFRASSEFQTMDNVRRAEVLPPSESNPRVPEDLDEAILRALKRAPEERYQTAADMARDLRAILSRYNFKRSELRDLTREFAREEWLQEQKVVEKSLSDADELPDDDSTADYGEFAEIFIEDHAETQDRRPSPAVSSTPGWMYALLVVSAALLAVAAYVVLR